MKGPLLTQSLRGMLVDGSLHWRGEKSGLSDFNATFDTLMAGSGDAAGLFTPAAGTVASSAFFADSQISVAAGISLSSLASLQLCFSSAQPSFS